MLVHCLKRELAFPFHGACGLDANSNGTDKSVNILPARGTGVFRVRLEQISTMKGIFHTDSIQRDF
jgi:hypothetical protein